MHKKELTELERNGLIYHRLPIGKPSQLSDCFRHGIKWALDSVAALQAERDALRNVCAEAYQMAGAINAPVEALNNLSAAANGDPIPHETFLPIFGDHLAAHDAEVAAKAVLDYNLQLRKDLDDKLPVHCIGVHGDEYAAQLRAKAKQ